MKKWDVTFDMPFLYHDIEAKSEEEAIEVAKQKAINEVGEIDLQYLVFTNVVATITEV